MTLGVLVALGILLLPAAAQAAFAGKNGGIAFEGTVSRVSYLYSINPDGTGLQKLAGPAGRFEGWPRSPKWSPDSRTIIFTRNTGLPPLSVSPPVADIYRMNAFGGDAARVLKIDGEIDLYPFWVSNRRIGFVRGSARSQGRPDTVETVDRDGGSRQVLFNISHTPTGGPSPVDPYSLALSPDGGTFASEVSTCTPFPEVCTPQLRMVNLDGTVRAALPFPAGGTIYDWSPDGRKLVLAAANRGGVFTINADGSGLTRLTEGDIAAWSPDGQQVAFRRIEPPRRVNGQLRGSSARLYVINADGSGERALPTGSLSVGSLSWGSAPPLATAACRVPGVRRKTLKAAKLAIRRANCRVGKITRTRSSTVRRGRVISQRPKAGKRLPSGAKVRMTVSRGSSR